MDTGMALLDFVFPEDPDRGGGKMREAVESEAGRRQPAVAGSCGARPGQQLHDDSGLLVTDTVIVPAG